MALSDNVPLSRRYLARAEECRKIAKSFHDEETQLKLLRLAADYDWMAMRAAAFELSKRRDRCPSPLPELDDKPFGPYPYKAACQRLGPDP